MSEITTALTLDILVLGVCTALLFIYGRLSALHPALVYLFFHFYTVTLRLVALSLGADLMFMPEPLSLSEVARAAQIFDAALAGATCVWLYLALRERRIPDRISRGTCEQAAQLSPTVVRIVAWSTIFVGIVGLRYLRFSDSLNLEQHSASLSGWETSSWVSQIITWAQQGSLMLAYVTGFQPVVTGLTALFFVLTMLGTSRYVLVIWGLFACFLSLSRKRLRWPTFRYTIWLVFVAVLWFPLKVIVASVWEGGNVNTIAANVDSFFAEAEERGGTPDTDFLDQAAITIGLMDDYGKFFHGGTLLPVLVSPVPRLWWPDKPPMNEYQVVISTPGRPSATYGDITTLVGEGYANFSYVGAILFPMLAAYLYGLWYFAAMRRPHNSEVRFLYLVVASMLIQVYRDGFVSAIVFPGMAAMPMMVLVVANWVIRSTRQRLAGAVGQTSPPSAVLNSPGF